MGKYTPWCIYHPRRGLILKHGQWSYDDLDGSIQRMRSDRESLLKFVAPSNLTGYVEGWDRDGLEIRHVAYPNETQYHWNGSSWVTGSGASRIEPLDSPSIQLRQELVDAKAALLDRALEDAVAELTCHVRGLTNEESYARTQLMSALRQRGWG